MTNKFLKLIGYAFVWSISLIASVASAAVVLPPAPKVTLSWDYPADQLSTNLTFNIYHTTNLNVPVVNWTILTNVVGTNLSAKLPITSGIRFFTITASNSAGESGFATVSF